MLKYKKDINLFLRRRFCTFLKKALHIFFLLLLFFFYKFMMNDSKFGFMGATNQNLHILQGLFTISQLKSVYEMSPGRYAV